MIITAEALVFGFGGPLLLLRIGRGMHQNPLPGRRSAVSTSACQAVSAAGGRAPASIRPGPAGM